MASVPFQKHHQLSSSLDAISSALSESSQDVDSSFSLPDYPSILLSDETALLEFLKEDLHSSELEAMAPYLWMLSTQSSSNISSLTGQRVKGRQIIITENPKLHLVWWSDRVFMKPIPSYLASHKFWDEYLSVDTGIDATTERSKEKSLVRRSALGFLRTYTFLIKHPSDLKIAKDLGLLPGDQGTTLEQFAKFKADLSTILDDDVSARYHFGELRLTRLNFYIKFVLGKWWFQKVQTTSGEYFARFYGPLLFVFTSLSLILSALQAEVAVEQVLCQSSPAGPGDVDAFDGIRPWVGFVLLTRWVAVLSFVIISVLSIMMVGLLISLHAREWSFAIQDRLKKRRNGQVGQA